MAFVYFNPNPRHKRSVGDCTVRSIAAALNISWETAYIDLASEGYDLGDMPSSNHVVDSFLRSKGFHKHIIDDLTPKCYSVSDFADEHFKGVYALGTGTHLVTVIDGNYLDSWDSGDECPLFFYERRT